MPSQTRRSSSSSKRRSAATRIQSRVRGKQTRKLYTNLVLTKQCALCLQHMAINEPITKLECGHEFHKECIQKSLSAYHNSCPLCRTPISSASARARHLVIPVSRPAISYNQTPFNRDRANAINNRLVAQRVYENTRARIHEYNMANAHRPHAEVESSPTFRELFRKDVRAWQALARAEESVNWHSLVTS
jgi:predicted Zn-ribbon and HTH transcriptional regulator